jgi:hypothetical protein
MSHLRLHLFSNRQVHHAALFLALSEYIILPGKFLVSFFLWMFCITSLHAKTAIAGVAWQIQGTWQVAGEGTPIRVGDAIQPASLLQPDDKSGDHSITVLLPDGQRVLYECFTALDCARGFRVPSLHGQPDAFALEMLAQIRTVLAAKNHGVSNGYHAEPTPQTSRDEAVAVLYAANRVQVAGLLTQLPKGRYTYDLRPLNSAYPPQFHLIVEKTAPSIDLALPAPGLYDVTITDALDTPRIDLFLAAIRPPQSADFESFRRAKEVMAQWNEDYTGWPIHDFLRAYLESLTQSAKLLPAGEIR